MERRDIVVIGASAGGMTALVNLVRSLPADFPASVFVVWHIASHSHNILPSVLARAGKLPAALALDRDTIVRGKIYVAPANRHLIVEPTRVRLVQGPKENRSRPSIDTLFRSAAVAFGQRTIGVILTGMLDDGTSGLWEIKHRGGVAIVQQPDEAEHSSMPLSALRSTDIDYVLPVNEIATALVRLVNEPLPAGGTSAESTEANLLNKMSSQELPTIEILKQGNLSTFACPECHGVMVRLEKGRFADFRCHTGHAYSAASLLIALEEAIETSMWNALRGLQELSLLINELPENGHSAEVDKLRAMLASSEKKAAALRRLLTETNY